MKVLYIATSFPEPNKGATIYTDLAEALFEAGHEITVAVSEQARNKENTEMNIERGFEVLRIVTGNYYDVGLLEKGITTLRIPILVRSGIKRYLNNRKFDLILFEAPPITNAGLVSWAKRQFNCPAYLMLKDIFPQNAVDLGMMKKGGIIFRYFKAKERKLYQTADIIGCMSDANKNYVLEHNPWLDPDKVELFPNTKKLVETIPERSSFIRDKYGIPKNACVFLFGGNMGRPQCIDLLCYAIEKCKDDKDIFFLFIGRGTDRYKLEQSIKKSRIKNALVIENLPRNEYEAITVECDLGLIILDPRFTIPNYPSRILSYMEYGKPFLAATDKVTDLQNLIKDTECGEWVWSGDAEGFVSKIKEMAVSDKLAILGNKGRKYIKENFCVKHSVEFLERYYNTKSKKLHVCFVAPTPPPYGGISNWVQLISRYLQSNKNIHVTVINTAPVSAKIEGRSIWERVVVQGIQIIKKLRELNKVIKENRPDVIHFTTSGQLAIFRDIVLLKTAKKKSIRTIYHLRFGRINEIEEKKTIEWKLLCRAMLTASKVIAIDRNTLAAINKGLPVIEPTYIPNPIDLSKLPEPAENDNRIILFLGWIIKTKGIEELLTAWSKISETHNDWILKLVGPCSDTYLEFLKSNFAFMNVIYEGEKSHDEAMKILNEAGILILPSYTEGFPNVILEAMALKKPIIATCVGAIPEMLSNECGILINPSDVVEIGRALEELITDNDERNKLRSNAYRKLINEYTIDNIFNSYMEMWSTNRD